MKIKASDIRRGMVITMENINYVVVDFMHHTPGNLRAMVQSKLRNLKTGSTIDHRFRSADAVEVAFVENKEYEYLFSQGDEHVFMDTESFDQISFAPEIVGTAMQFLLLNARVSVTFIDSKAVSLDLPATVELSVIDTPPEMKGATATNQYKDAELETGLRIKVPSFIENGTKVKIDTRTGEYLARV